MQSAQQAMHHPCPLSSGTFLVFVSIWIQSYCRRRCESTVCEQVSLACDNYDYWLLGMVDSPASSPRTGHRKPWRLLILSIVSHVEMTVSNLQATVPNWAILTPFVQFGLAHLSFVRRLYRLSSLNCSIRDKFLKSGGHDFFAVYGLVYGVGSFGFRARRICDDLMIGFINELCNIVQSRPAIHAEMIIWFSELP